MKRVIPENYVVLLQNLPVDVDTKEKLENILLNIKNGIRYIVPIPKQSGKLTKILKQLQSLFDQLKQGQQMMEDFNANQAYRSAVVKLIPQHQKVKKALKQKKADKLKRKEYKQIQKVSNVMFKIRSCYQEILKIKAVDNIEIEHLKQILSIPPPLPEMLINAFDLLPDSTQMIPQIRYPSNKYLHNIQQNHQDYQQQNIMLEHTEQQQHHIGHAAFIICQSQAIAAEKYTTLIAQNSQKPKAMLASNSQEIIWENVATNDKKRKWSYYQYIFWLIVLFIAYVYGQAQLNKLLIDTSLKLQKQIFQTLNFSGCIQGLVQTSIQCSILESFSKFLPTFITSFIIAFLMALLPQFLKLIARLLRYPSTSQANDKLFNLNFAFLIIIQGIIQVAIPELINAQTGAIDFSFFKEFSITTLFRNLGSNIVNLQFTFITFIITNYFTSPAFSLLNIYYLLSATINKMKLTNYLEYNVKLRFITFNFPKQLAYLAHMLVLGYIFAIVSPITNIIIFVTYIMMVTIDRYMILYVRIPDVSADLSAQSNMLVNVIGAIFIGLFFMIFSTCCYFFVQESNLSYLGIAVCIISLIFAVTKKILIDKAFKRALTEMTRGNYDETVGVKLNPAHIDSEYTEDDNYLSRYDLNNSDHLNQLAIKYHLMQKQVIPVPSSAIIEENLSAQDLQLKLKKRIKQRVFDKILKKMYLDLTDLPVSIIRYDDIRDDEGERICRPLLPEHIKTVEFDTTSDEVIILEDKIFSKTQEDLFKNVFNNRSKKLGQEDLMNIAAHYTHPSLQFAIYGEQIVKQQ
ncbi:Transmembrane_domain-containing protein [Hexamita inflata]|nr:Transmembrane domain-containing protein [Hexamita inflata]